MSIPVYPTEVIRAAPLTPWMRRIVIGGESLADFGWKDLPDERVKLFLPRRDGESPPLPTITETGYEFPPDLPRPTARTFTIRRFDPARAELTIDIAGHGGPAASWSERARPGDRIGIAGPSHGWEPGTKPGRYLLCGDEAGLPGIATILERLPAEARTEVLLEIGDESAKQPLESAAELEVTWIGRDGAPSDALRRAIFAHELLAPSSARRYIGSRDGIPARDRPAAQQISEAEAAPATEPFTFWAAGESFAMREVRRLVRDELALTRERFLVVGYWRQGLNEDEAIDAHVAATDAVRARGGSLAEIENAGLY